MRRRVVSRGRVLHRRSAVPYTTCPRAACATDAGTLLMMFGPDRVVRRRSPIVHDIVAWLTWASVL